MPFSSPSLRLTWLALLSLCIATPALANRVKKPAKKGKTSAKANAKQKGFANARPRPSAKKVTTNLSGTFKASPAIVRVSHKASVTLADAAVISHLAAPLMLRGPKANRLSAPNAKAKISKQWQITDSRIIDSADPIQHPITGNATLVVDAQRAAKSKVGKSIGLKTKRQFVVNISTKGKATVLGERSGAAPAKFIRKVNEKLAVSRIVKDVLASSGVRKAGAGIGVLALAVLAGNSGINEFAQQLTQQLSLLGPVALTAATISAKNGMGRRTTARLHAFEQLTQDFGRELQAGKHITVEKAYSRYETALKEVKIGNIVTKNVKAPSRETFVKALAAWEAGLNISQ